MRKIPLEVLFLKRGRFAVELANAATLSSSVGQEVALPLVRSHYENFINGKLVES